MTLLTFHLLVRNVDRNIFRFLYALFMDKRKQSPLSEFNRNFNTLNRLPCFQFSETHCKFIAGRNGTYS